ncbi:MAG: FMN-binding protein [Planctomycetaceae bacterium]
MSCGFIPIIPQRIIARQNLQVDGITGATITKDALVAGTLRALKQAGLK